MSTQKATDVQVEKTISNDAFSYSEEDAHHGALIVEEERHLGLVASAKLHWRALLICKRALL